jgi:hypothetical protein
VLCDICNKPLRGLVTGVTILGLTCNGFHGKPIEFERSPSKPMHAIELDPPPGQPVFPTQSRVVALTSGTSTASVDPAWKAAFAHDPREPNGLVWVVRRFTEGSS